MKVYMTIYAVVDVDANVYVYVDVVVCVLLL